MRMETRGLFSYALQQNILICIGVVNFPSKIFPTKWNRQNQRSARNYPGIVCMWKNVVFGEFFATKTAKLDLEKKTVLNIDRHQIVCSGHSSIHCYSNRARNMIDHVQSISIFTKYTKSSTKP